MYDSEVPIPSSFDREPDEFRATLEQNALARWWRDRAGSSGETGARFIARDSFIARDIPAATTDESDPIDLDD
jgi:hypothetical protein